MNEQSDDRTAALVAALQGARGNIADLAAAYVAAWGELDNVVKNADNPHFGSTYADLGAVIDTVRPVFAKHGLALLTAPGECEGDKIGLIWMLVHRSGQSLNGRMSLPMGKATAQAGGSAITYMRRYLTAAISGVAQVDDDGNAASEAPREKKSSNPRGQSAAKTAGPSYAQKAEDLITRVEGCRTLEELEGVRTEIAELGDQKVADAYVSKKKELRGKK